MPTFSLMYRFMGYAQCVVWLSGTGMQHDWEIQGKRYGEEICV